MNTKRLTTEEFIKKAKEIHGDKYNYSKVEYINNLTKVCIICPIHGEFWQTPKSHCNGHGCQKCGNLNISEKLRGKIKHTISDRKFKHKKNTIYFEKYKHEKINDINDFIRISHEIHGNKYDYSKVNYINNRTKVCIICPEHGEFWQTPESHCNGHGCQKCSKHLSGIKQKYIKDDFIKFAIEIYNDKYDYSKINYIDYNTKVCIICPEHGEFWQTPRQHLNACGCKKCISEKLQKKFSMNEDTFKSRASKLFFGIYGYEHVKYINNSTNVLITCNKHGDFTCTPANHLKGRGCPICKTEKYVYEGRLYNLLLSIFDENEIKRQYKSKWLTHNKSLDFFIEKYNIAIEHQGSQHFIEQSLFGGIKKYERCKILDYEKFNECINNNVTLIYFSYEKTYVPDKYFSKVYTEESEFIEKIKKIINNTNNE